jgi:hypothetical protein
VDYIPSDRVYIEDDLGLDAPWLAARLHDDPALLSLSDNELTVVDVIPSDRPEALTVFLVDVASGIRHVAEVKLGDADLHQVVRVLEFWADRHADHPDAEHQPSVVAEHITPEVARAVLMAQEVVPVGAYELHALHVGEAVALHTEPVEPPATADTDSDEELAALLADTLERLDPRGPEHHTALRQRMIDRLKRESP